MAQEKNNLKTKGVLVAMPHSLHVKCNRIKAHRFLEEEKASTLSSLIIEMMMDALEMPKYKEPSKDVPKKRESKVLN